MPESSVNLSNHGPLRHDLQAELVPIDQLKSFEGNARIHPKGQIRKLAVSLSEFGFVLPVIIDAQKRVVAGSALIEAALRLECTSVPCVTIGDLSETQIRALRLSLNRLAEDSRWDEAALKAEFARILAIDSSFDLTLSGFEIGEIDRISLGTLEAEEDSVPELPDRPVSRLGDLWLLGPHRLYCGDATGKESFDRLMQGDKASMAFTDSSYNVAIAGNVSGLGAVTHDEFAMASGEMNSDEFTAFLATVFRNMAEVSEEGSIHFACMDWRHVTEMMTAGTQVFTSLRNICVWNKTSGAMGSLYRSKHEFVFVWKKGRVPHTNNVQLGRLGRSRTNVWDYAGLNSFGTGRKEELALHPTVKPVALVADAILDVSRQSDIVLDPFCGSGSTLIAAERTRRIARAIELDPKYVDVTLKRFEAHTGIEPVLWEFGESFTEVAKERSVSDKQ